MVGEIVCFVIGTILGVALVKLGGRKAEQPRAASPPETALMAPDLVKGPLEPQVIVEDDYELWREEQEQRGK